jgi:thioredoxin-dependent adenylylsulfate APS reductase
MADADPHSPWDEPAAPIVDKEADWVLESTERFEHVSAEELLAWALERFHPRMAISAGGGVDGMVLIDMAWRLNPNVRVFTLDTGRLPPETFTLFEEVRERYGIEVELEVPDAAAISRLVTQHGPNPMYRSVDLRILCCEIRKVEPLRRKLATLDAWVAGLRREQLASRRNIAKVELDREHGDIVKLNPLADWTLHRVWDYIRTNEVPYHELFDHGYTSIGCAPCTRPVAPGEAERAGRWWWERDTNKECGIHEPPAAGHAVGRGSPEPPMPLAVVPRRVVDREEPPESVAGLNERNRSWKEAEEPFRSVDTGNPGRDL